MEEQAGIISGESKYGFRVDIIGQNITLTPVEEDYKYTLIWMHGLCDSAFGHVDMFYKEKSMAPKNTKVILPTAPKRPVTINGGASSNSWYGLIGPTMTDFSQSEVDKSAKIIIKIIQREAEILEGNMRRIFVGGFSQGACMSTYIALTSPCNLGGVVACSGVLFNSIDFQQLDPDKKLIPIYIYQGKADSLVNVYFAQKTYEQLFLNGYNANFVTEALLDHSISETEQYIITKFLLNSMQ